MHRGVVWNGKCPSLETPFARRGRAASQIASKTRLGTFVRSAQGHGFESLRCAVVSDQLCSLPFAPEGIRRDHEKCGISCYLADQVPLSSSQVAGASSKACEPLERVTVEPLIPFQLLVHCLPLPFCLILVVVWHAERVALRRGGQT